MEQSILKPKDFASDQDVKWCPGCGDYSILKQVQAVLPDQSVKREDVVFVSGIGCSSRFPYYMNTYGIHSIHGRAPAIATGLKIVNPDLNVWLVTGDGDGLSIGGNHLIHLARRNVNLNVLLFNNEIYGLTKGQFSPTSQVGLKTKSSPMGVIDRPFNPASLLFGASASFIARSMDRDPKNLRLVLQEANRHQGTSFLEIYQNCHVFNDGVFEEFSNKETKDFRALNLEEGKPLLFDRGTKAVVLEGISPKVVEVADYQGEFWIHDPYDKMKGFVLCQMGEEADFPRPFGILYKENRDCYENLASAQIAQAEGSTSLDDLLRGNQYWNISE